MSPVPQTRSGYSAVSKLLRCFHDDEALLRNPLVAHHFHAVTDVAATAERARGLVLAAINRIVDLAPPNEMAVAKRYKHILVRHDIEGMPREKLCEELGLSERQLYRDRSQASEQLAMQLSRALPRQEASPNGATASSVDVAEVALQAAIRMDAVGATRVAAERVEAIARSADRSRWRSAALCLLARNAGEREDFPETRRLVRDLEAEVAAHKSQIEIADLERCKAFLEMTHGIIAWHAAPKQQDVQLARKGFNRFFAGPSQGSSVDDPLAQALLRTAVLLSGILSDIGDFAGCVAILNDLQCMLDRSPRTPDYLKLEHRVSVLKMEILVKSDHKSIALGMSETVERAQQAGLWNIASEAAHYAGWIAARAGNPEPAKIFQANSLAYADAQDSLYRRSYAYANAALVEQHIGTPERALELAQASKNFAQGNVSAYAGYVLARAHLNCGLAEEAIDAGERLTNAASSGEIARGATLLVMAEAAVKLGRRNAASYHIDRAIAHLRPYGNTYLLSDARSMRARLKSPSS